MTTKKTTDDETKPFDQSDGTHLLLVRKCAHWIVLFGGTALAFSFIGYTIFSVMVDPDFKAVVVKHFAAVIGLPAAAIAALGIVLLLEGTAGRIEFEAFSIKFKGAAAPIVFWIFCFLAIAGAIRLNWQEL